MGSGKSTIGFHLSYRIQTPFIDSDKKIERDHGMTISEIFASEGEESFREMETALLRKLSGERGHYILSTGGGLPMREKNQKLLRQMGKVIYLKATAETLYERVKEDTTRPLLQCADPLAKIREMLEIRGPIYERCADWILEIDGLSQEEILDLIIPKYEKKKREWGSKK